MASIISAILIVLTLLFLTPLFYFLPKAMLASVIMVAVFGLIDYKEAIHLWHSNRTDFAMLIITFIATLGLGIEQGIGVGVILSLAMVIYRTTRPHVAVLGKVPDSHFYRNVNRFDGLEVDPKTLIVRFDAQMYFANTNYFKDILEQLADERGKQLKYIIINAESMNNLDSSAVHALEEVIEDYRLHGVTDFFTGVKGPVRDAMVKGHLIEKIGKDHFFMSVQEAVDFVNAKKNKASNQEEHFEEYTLQTNV